MANQKNLKTKCERLTVSQWKKLPKTSPLKNACKPLRSPRGPTVRWDINYSRLFGKKVGRK